MYLWLAYIDDVQHAFERSESPSGIEWNMLCGSLNGTRPGDVSRASSGRDVCRRCLERLTRVRG